MHKKLTITVDEKVYQGLHKKIGSGRISQFIEDLVRPHVIKEDLEASYEMLAKEELREKEALEISEGVIEDIGDESR
jgi:hypothetical protein